MAPADGPTPRVGSGITPGRRPRGCAEPYLLQRRVRRRAHHRFCFNYLPDSIDFLEDTSVNILILIALGWMLVGALHVGYGARWHPARSWPRDALDRLGQVLSSITPAPLPLSLTGAGAMGSGTLLVTHARALSHPGGQLGSERRFCRRGTMFWLTRRSSVPDLSRLTPCRHGPIWRLDWHFLDELGSREVFLAARKERAEATP